MTLAGWEPWLFDTLHLRQSDAQQTFDTYVRAGSVLLAPGEAGRNHVATWRGPWLAAHPMRRACPLCAADPERGTALMWRLPLVAGCADHGCRLESVFEVAFAASQGKPMAPAPVNEHLAALDRRTHQGLTTGMVALPGRSVHVGVWFRLLRTLLDEVSMSLSRVGVRSRATLERIWRATGHPVRAGLAVWRPYERLAWPAQEMMLHAAAVALHLADTGAITPRGTLGAVLTKEPRRSVYDGDQPQPVPPGRWGSLQEALEAAIEAARTDPDAARQMLAWLTIGCRTRDRFEEERAYLFGLGIPADFLPSAGELGRVDLI